MLHVSPLVLIGIGYFAGSLASAWDSLQETLKNIEAGTPNDALARREQGSEWTISEFHLDSDPKVVTIAISGYN